MPAKHRPAPRTQETVYRVHRLPEKLRTAVTKKRKQFDLKLYEFISCAVEHELPSLIRDAEKLELPGNPGPDWRPARLPFTDPLLAQLKKASEATGIPASRLFLASLARACRRKRRWSSKAAK